MKSIKEWINIILSLKRGWFATVLFVIVLGLLALAAWCENTILHGIVNSIACTLLGLLIVSLIYQWLVENELAEKTVQHIKKAFDEDLEEKAIGTVTTALTGRPEKQHVPLVYSLYERDALERLLHSFLEAYCTNKELANTHLNYIKENCNLIKRDEIYKVKIGCDEQTHKRYIDQSLTDTRIFRRSEKREDFILQIFLSFKSGERVTSDKSILDRKLRDTSFFFREELPDEDQINKLIDLTEELEKIDGAKRGIGYDPQRQRRRKEIVREIIEDILHYRVFIYRQGEKKEWLPLKRSKKNGDDELSRFTVRLESVTEGSKKCPVKKYAGMIIETRLPDERVDKSPELYKDFRNENFCQYRAEINLQYDIPTSHNTFYAVYTAPVFNASFSLVFETSFGEFDCFRDLEYMTFFSAIGFASEEERRNEGCKRTQRTFDFQGSQVVFPRSGISFCWSNPPIRGCRTNHPRGSKTQRMHASKEPLPIRDAG